MVIVCKRSGVRSRKEVYFMEEVNWKDQFSSIERDIAWDEYVESCMTSGVPVIPFEEWNRNYYITYC